MPVSQADKQQFIDIITAIWYDVDYGDSTNVQHYFSEDATLAFGERLVVGRQAIHDGYQARRNRGVRTSRHMITNTHIVDRGDDWVELVSLLLLYAADGVPVQPAADPLSVTDQWDRFERNADGEWLLVSRKLSNLFVREGATFSEPPSQV